MIEKAIFIHSGPKNRALLSADGARPFSGEYSRLYFGIEFCERLIPSVEELSAAIKFSKNSGMKFTFVTPFVTDAGLALLEPLADHIREAGIMEETELVINDWGFLNLLDKKGWSGPLSLGRLLTKQKRGPRIMNILDKLPPAAIEHFKQSNVDVPSLAGFLKEKGIRRVELDNLLQGVSRPQASLKASLYYPYAYVTVTRYCAMIPSQEKKLNLRSILACSRDCQNHEFELSHKSMPVKLLLKGNTQFIKNDRLPQNLEKLNIDRLVFQLCLPI